MLEKRAKTEITAIARMTNLPFLCDKRRFAGVAQETRLTGSGLTLRSGLLTHPIFNAGLWITKRVAEVTVHRSSRIRGFDAPVASKALNAGSPASKVLAGLDVSLLFGIAY
jgi:hypothetical protein